MPQNKVTFGIGQKFDKAGIELFALGVKKYSPLYFKQLARAKTAEVFGGYSEISASGGWVNAKGLLVTEPSVLFVVYTDKDYDVCETHAEWLAELFDQESVMLAVEPVTELQFVGQKKGEGHEG